MEPTPYLATPSLLAEYGGPEGMAARLEWMGYQIISGPDEQDNGCVLFMVEMAG